MEKEAKGLNDNVEKEMETSERLKRETARGRTSEKGIRGDDRLTLSCWREILLTHKQHLQRPLPPSRLPSSPSSSPLTARPSGMTHPFDLLSPPSLLPTSKSRKLTPRNAHEDMKETHVDLQISRSIDKHTGLHTHTCACLHRYLKECQKC